MATRVTRMRWEDPRVQALNGSWRILAPRASPPATRPCTFLRLLPLVTCQRPSRWRVSAPGCVVNSVCSYHLRPQIEQFAGTWWPPSGGIDVSAERIEGA